MAFHRFLELVDPGLYQEYQKERVSAGLWKRTSGRRTNPEPVVDSGPTSPKEARLPVSDDPLFALTRVDLLREGHRARVLCESRKIPDLTKLYHCPRFYAWTNHVLKREKFSKKALYYDHPRLVIPFHTGGRLTAFQGRDYDPGSDNKYVTIRVDESIPAVYGLDGVGPGTKYAFEGPIDSMFVPNSIAFAGGTHAPVPKDFVVVYDNEPRAKLTVRKVARAIADGYPVCVWPASVKQKDVNDMVLAGLDPKQIIDSRTFSGLAAELELALWKRSG